MPAQKVVICGAGFLGEYRKHIARNIVSPATKASVPERIVQLSSRNPARLLQTLQKDLPQAVTRLQATPLDITKPETLAPAFEGAHTVVSLVGLMHGKPEDFERAQWRGAENVAKAAKEVGARLIHISAIGANPASEIAYWRTKGLGEEAVRSVHSNATIIRPSLVFGPEDDFFNRFSKLSIFLPFLPVFGGGQSKFQPVYVDDIAKAVEVMSRGDPEVEKKVSGKIIEAGGPRVYTYYDLMVTVLKYSHRNRLVISFPYWMGMMQGFAGEMLPPNLFTVTRDQIRQLGYDNIINPNPGPGEISFDKFLQEHYSHSPTPLIGILPSYLGLY
ncbi:putative nucleoside-diphosphate-sugar epimerase [Coprinellus micaceus]|uniref:Putative nucleoside-diphosphate-sugar epimerase n=1 Tax=Coprinellus micaceus TaxID=71717 RepID=A0A4Y7TY58_COPMI|nr:putative nucleoside-diphosphate-sugar epimerase [Coprinellus micaceus]